MPTLDVLNTDKQKVGTIQLSDAVFAAEVNHPLVHQVILAQLANARQGTAKTKTKAEIRGGGKKPFRQKGTGNARQGSSRSPLMPGGGANFGPQPRSYRQATPEKMIRGALRSLLSDRMNAERIVVLDAFKVSKPKTKEVAAVLGKKLQLEKVLVVDSANEGLERAGRNVKNVKILRAEMLNAYDVAKYDWLLMTKSAVESIEKRLGSEA